jgi:mono/diheme cytochrome c family protein
VNKGPFLIFGAFAVLCLVLIPLKAISGTGGESAAPVSVASQDEAGKELFANACGSCHTLAAAGTDGVVGPNLDQLLAPGGNATYEASYNRALAAITCGFGAGRMPAGILQGENAKEVAAFVGAYAGQAGDTSEPLVDTDDADEAPQDPPPESCGGDESTDSG